MIPVMIPIMISGDRSKHDMLITKLFSRHPDKSDNLLEGPHQSINFNLVTRNFLMKRAQENQLIKDAYENDDSDLDGEGTAGGSVSLTHGFTRATDTELAGRRIVKAKRPARSGEPVASEGSSFTNNPFASLPPVAGNSNPFGGIKLTTTASAPVSIPINIVNSVSSSVPVTKAVLQSTESLSNIKSSSAVSSMAGQSQYDAKLSKLNSSFLGWMDSHFADQPLSIWKDACKDYIKYSNDIADKYYRTDNEVEQNKQTSLSQPLLATSTSARKVETFPVTGERPSGGFDKNVGINDAAPKTNSLPANSQMKISLNSTAGSSASDGNSLPAFGLPKFPSSTSTEPGKTETSAATKLPSFSFGVPPPANNLVALDASKSSFSLPSFGNGLNTTVAGASSSAGGFNLFSLNPSNGSSDLPKPAFGAFGGFSMPSTNSVGIAFSGSTATTLPTTVGAGEDGGDDGEPILAPEEVLKNENDLDEVCHEMDCKIMRFVPPKEWKDMGKGIFKVTKDTQTGKWRMVMRNLTGKVMFNAPFHPGIKFEGVNNTIKFSGYVANEDNKTELRMFLLKIRKDPILLATTLAKLNEGARSSSK